METGSEMPYKDLCALARTNGCPVVARSIKSLQEALEDEQANFEGYVLTWDLGLQPPLKLKIKTEEYCRLHRILTGLNPRSIWEMLVPPSMLVQNVPKRDEDIDTSDIPEVSDWSKAEVGKFYRPGVEEAVAERRRATVDSILSDSKMPAAFIDWFGGWVTQLRKKYADMEARAKDAFYARRFKGPWATEPSPEALRMVRKANAEDFKATPELTGILFAMLDGKDYEPIIWKHIKPRGDETFKKDGE